MLELFSRTSHDNDDDISAEHQELVSNAAAGIEAMQTRFRQSAARRNGATVELQQPRVGQAEADCIICYTERANRLFMPCKHLVVCSVTIHSDQGCGGKLADWLSDVL